MNNDSDHVSVWQILSPYITPVFGFALTALMAAFAWGMNDRKQVGKELAELRQLVAEHASQLRRIFDIHQRWRDGELLKDEYTAYYSELSGRLLVIENKVDHLLKRTRGSRRSDNGDDE